MEDETQSGRGKSTVYVVGIIAILLIAMYVWKVVSVGRVERAAEAQRTELVETHKQLEARIEGVLEAQAEDMLRLFAVPMGWAVRTEAIREDWDQIEEYAVRMVKEPAVRLVAFVDDAGDVKITTDRKLQGEPAARFFGNLTMADQVTLRTDATGDFLVMVPVLGYDERLGSVVVTLSRETLFRNL